jgi:outer membrane protein assembly factor BamB
LVPQRDGSLKAVWKMSAPPNAVWLGAPAVEDNRIVAASVRKSGNKLTYAIHAFDEAGQIWSRSILDCECPSGDPKTRHDLVTIADDTVVFNTNAGATVAMDVRSGRLLWAWKYPRLIPRGKALAMAWTANHRDISPPIIDDGVAVITPTDTARIAGIEVRSGRMLWDQVGYHVETVIGVGDRKVVAVMAGPIRGIRAFDLRTGSDEWPHGWANYDDPGLASLGRGLVSHDVVLWPTRTGLYTLDLKTGRPARLPVLGPHGNLAFARGSLIVANPTELRGYVSAESNRQAGR